MSPSGDGERENSRHDFFICEYGDRWPFSCGGTPLVSGADFETLLLGVRPLIRRCLEVEMAPLGWLFVVKTGDLDRVRARFSRLESEPEPSFSSDIGAGDLCLCCFAAERVVGAK